MNVENPDKKRENVLQPDISVSLTELLDKLSENDAAYKEAAILKLSKIMEEESAKPEEEIDYDLIAECAKMTAELRGIQTTFSDDEFQAMIEQTKLKFKSTQKHHQQVKKLLIAACITVFTFVIGISIISASCPYFRIWQQFSKKTVGETIVDETNEYVYAGKGDIYLNIEDLIRKENLSLLYPKTFPESLQIDNIIYLNEITPNCIMYVFNDANYSVSIVSCSEIPENIRTHTKAFTLNNNIYYKNDNPIDGEYYIYTLYKNYFYTFKGMDYAVLNEIVSNLEEVDYE